MNFQLSQKSINESEYTLFKDYIAQRSGIVIPPEKYYLLETRFSKFMADAGTDSFSEFYDYLISGLDPMLPEKLINSITTNETRWFRDETPWKILESSLLPGLVDALISRKKARVRIWSAAASTGQEIYSTAMCIDNYLAKHHVKEVSLSDFDFLATDISSHVLSIAKKGRYDKISINRGLNETYKNKYFTENSSAWDIDPRIRGAVRFERFNLQHNYTTLGMFDIVFCRYVLIYFSDELKKEIISKIHSQLFNGGVLFTGNYALYNLFEDGFNMSHCENLTYYTKKGGL